MVVVRRRRLDVGRMRRHVARTTPDQITFTVDLELVDPSEAQEVFARWERRMAVKHPGRKTTGQFTLPTKESKTVTVRGRVKSEDES